MTIEGYTPDQSASRPKITELNRLGNRLIEAGYLTKDERDAVLKRQQEMREKEGCFMRFGELAVGMGFCTHDQVENLPGYLGQQLMEHNIITEEQRQQLIEWQQRLRHRGIFVRFGELAVSEGFCTEQDIEMVLQGSHCPVLPKH